MKDRINSLLLAGILVSLLIIAFKPAPKIELPITSQPNITLNNGEFIQIAPGVIGIKDNGTHSGYLGQLLLFQFQENSQGFKFIGTLNYEEYMNHPEKYEIPIRNK